MISGTISGGLVGVAWIIGFIIYFYKRNRRERRARALGYRGHREMLDPPKKREAFIIPPDPAIVESGLIPGERIYDDDHPKDDAASAKQARPFSFTRLQKMDSKSSSSSTNDSMPNLASGSSAPTKVAYIKPPSAQGSYDHVALSPLGRRSDSDFSHAA